MTNMKRLMLNFLGLALIITTLLSPEVTAAERRRVVVRPGFHRAALVIHPGFPIRRAFPREVIVRPARTAVVVGGPLTFLPVLAWTPRVVTLPVRERLVWQDSETIKRDEEWVDTNFGVDGQGNALLLEIKGKAQINFAEVVFANGNAQVVDFNEKTHGSGIYTLLDFADGRHVKTVRILAKSKSDDTTLAVYLSK